MHFKLLKNELAEADLHYLRISYPLPWSAQSQGKAAEPVFC